MTPEQFFKKNLKWFLLILWLLFCFKTIQSCNRKMNLSMTSKKYIHIIDSLENKYNVLEKNSNDSIKKLNFELRLQNERTGAAEKNANDIKNTIQNVKQNINLNIRGAQIDTIIKRK